LDEKPFSKLIFKPQIHERGIRGFIIRQKRNNKTEEWKDEESLKLKDLSAVDGVNFEIPSEGVKNLFLGIKQLGAILHQRGVEYGENHYTVVDPNSVIITDENKAQYISKILEAGYGEETWKSIVDLNPNLATQLSYARIQIERKKVLDELEKRLKKDYSEVKGNDSWQNWISKNNWLFGVNYKEPIEKVKINLSGIMPDYLYPTIDGFVDVLEIKLPNDDVLVEDSSHKGSWRWTPETNSAIGQVINYLTEIDRLRFENENKVQLEVGKKNLFLKPRAFILIGNSEEWNNPKKEALRKLNYYLHNIEVITYIDLLGRGKNFINSHSFFIQKL
ncbi:MAG: DUF4263 domain-containing protein, partial [bacterium]|nr:DUF4263 domain-containing protein [bacterium]